MSPLFKRNDKTTIAELEEYYANQKKRRSGMAWLMALLSLFITVAVIVLLFLGGRWVYRTFIDSDSTTGDDSETALVEGSNDDVDLPNFDSNDLGADRGVSFEEGSSNNPEDLVVGADNNTPSSSSEGVVSEEAASTDIPNTDRLAANSSIATETSSVAGDNTSTEEGKGEANDTIPNTGAGESMLIILIAITALGYLTSRKFQLRKQFCLDFCSKLYFTALESLEKNSQFH